MPEMYTLTEAQAFYDVASAALVKAMHAESYGTGENSLTRAKVKDLSDQCDKWKRIIDRYSSGKSNGISVTGVTPV